MVYGGIRANDSYPADFIRDNLAVQLNVIHEAWRTGPGDTCDLKNSHVLPALILKIHEAKRHGERQVTLWGSGKLLDVSRLLSLGWRPRTALRDGIALAYADFLRSGAA